MLIPKAEDRWLFLRKVENRWLSLRKLEDRRLPLREIFSLTEDNNFSTIAASHAAPKVRIAQLTGLPQTSRRLLSVACRDRSRPVSLHLSRTGRRLYSGDIVLIPYQLCGGTKREPSGIWRLNAKVADKIILLTKGLENILHAIQEQDKAPLRGLHAAKSTG